MMKDADAGRVQGSLRSADGTGVVRVETRFDTDIDDVWTALTDPTRLARWHGQVEGDLRPGGPFRIYIAGDDWEGTGRIRACERPVRLVVTTRESEASWRKGQGAEPFDSTTEATLREQGARTILVVEVGGIPWDTIAFYGVGWQIHLEHLAAYLAGEEPDDVEARWDELLPGYQDLAAHIGS